MTTPRGDSVTLELRLDRDCRRWITRTLEGDNVGGEVWTHAFAVSSRRTDIVVDFFVPDVAPDARDRVGDAFCSLYEKLYDEDVAMMSERQRQLDKRIDPEVAPEPLKLGALDELRLPLQVDFGGRGYHVVRSGGELIVHAARCPHQMGPLEPAAAGVVQCPWHGYRFDAKTGACLTGQLCRLTRAPRVLVRDGCVWLES